LTRCVTVCGCKKYCYTNIITHPQTATHCTILGRWNSALNKLFIYTNALPRPIIFYQPSPHYPRTPLYRNGSI